MTRVILFIFFLGLLSCNPLKKIEKQQAQLSQLVDKVLSARVVQARDSLVFIPGAVIETRDTLSEIERTDSTTVFKFYYNHSTIYRDTLKYFIQDTDKEQALQAQSALLRGELAGKNVVIADKKEALKHALIALGCMAVFIGTLLFLILKNR